MKDKNMIGGNIYYFRKQKGYSQAELASMLGITNKAVSKWETEEANPDISLLPKIANALDITLDELICGEYSVDENGERKNFGEKKKVLGFDGVLINTPERYEFVSDKKTKKGKPYLHVNIGRRFETINSKASGVIAIGNRAQGFFSIGLISKGFFSIGLLSLGVFALGLFCLGLIAIATVALGGVAFGAVSVGGISFGAISIGYISYGALAIGHYAYTADNGLAIGKHIHIYVKNVLMSIYNRGL